MSRARRTHIYVLNQIATSMGTVDEVDESLTDGFGLRECSIESVHSITADCQDWVQYNETEEMWEALDPTCTNWESEVDYVLVCTSLREAQTYNEEEPDPLPYVFIEGDGDGGNDGGGGDKKTSSGERYTIYSNGVVHFYDLPRFEYTL